MGSEFPPILLLVFVFVLSCFLVFVLLGKRKWREQDYGYKPSNVKIACPNCSELIWATIPEGTKVTKVLGGSQWVREGLGAVWKGRCMYCRGMVYVWAE